MVRAVLVSLLASLLLVAAPATAAPVAPGDDDVGKGDLLTLEELATYFPELAVKSYLDFYKYGLTTYEFTTAPLRCDRYGTVRGTSRIEASAYSVKSEPFSILQDLVVLRTGAEAKALVQHYRDYLRACRGTYATTDGEGGAAKSTVRGWRPRKVGKERVGLLVSFEQYGEVNWYRTLVTRVGKTVAVLELSPRSGLGDGRAQTKAARALLERVSAARART